MVEEGNESLFFSFGSKERHALDCLFLDLIVLVDEGVGFLVVIGVGDHDWIQTQGNEIVLHGQLIKGRLLI